MPCNSIFIFLELCIRGKSKDGNKNSYFWSRVYSRLLAIEDSMKIVNCNFVFFNVIAMQRYPFFFIKLPFIRCSMCAKQRNQIKSITVALADIRSYKKQTRCAKNNCIISNPFCYNQKLPNAYITRDKIYILNIAKFV